MPKCEHPPPARSAEALRCPQTMAWPGANGCDRRQNCTGASGGRPRWCCGQSPHWQSVVGLDLASARPHERQVPQPVCAARPRAVSVAGVLAFMATVMYGVPGTRSSQRWCWWGMRCWRLNCKFAREQPQQRARVLADHWASMLAELCQQEPTSESTAVPQ